MTLGLNESNLTAKRDSHDNNSLGVLAHVPSHYHVIKAFKFRRYSSVNVQQNSLFLTKRSFGPNTRIIPGKKK